MKYTDRAGASLEMIQRKVRLTEDENEMLNELLEFNQMTLRDLIAALIEDEYIKQIGGKRDAK